MSIAKMTRKGQITIPKHIREKLGIAETDYVVIVLDGDKAVISRVRPQKPADLRGKLPATRPYPGTEAVRQEVGRELGRKRRETE